MNRTLIFLLMTIPILAPAQEVSPEAIYQQHIDKARADYRKAIAKKIRDAKEVELLLLRFDDVKDFKKLAGVGEVDRGRFPVAPYKATTSVMSAKKFNAVQCKELLLVLAGQIEKPVHSGGAFCHFPIHGVRIYSNERSKDGAGNVVYSGTFCWVCENFGFEYPDGNEWLDTSDTLRDVFNKLLPIPVEEKQRFEKKYPTKPKRNQSN